MKPHIIELKLKTVHQLFNSMDPSPFHERDLDHDAETFIESWAQERPRHAPIRIIIHLGETPAESPEIIGKSIQNYFDYKAGLSRNNLSRILREGWTSLLIGIPFLVACTMAAHSVAASRVISEGLTIIGWVAMWRPLEIYLYRWWPILSLVRTYKMLAAAEVEVRTANSDKH